MKKVKYGIFGIMMIISSFVYADTATLLTMAGLLSQKSSLDQQAQRSIRAITTNSADLESFRGTTWEFTYITVTGVTSTKTISCLDAVVIDKDESVYLPCSNENGVVAVLSYYSPKHILVINNNLKESYSITLIDCCHIQGDYFIAASDPNFQRPYAFTGVRLSGPATTPLTPSNGGDFEAGKQAGIQQCVNNPDSCGIPNQFETGKQAGIGQCQADPATCGINTMTMGVHATYSPVAGEVHIPLIDVPGPFGGTQIYEIYLIQQPSTFNFSLDTNRIILK